VISGQCIIWLDWDKTPVAYNECNLVTKNIQNASLPIAVQKERLKLEGCLHDFLDGILDVRVASCVSRLQPLVDRVCELQSVTRVPAVWIGCHKDV